MKKRKKKRMSEETKKTIAGLGGHLGGGMWLGLAGILGAGLVGASKWGSKSRRDPETKTEKAHAVIQDLSDIGRELDSMSAGAECLLGTDAQETTSLFNPETAALLGKASLLRRRAMILKARLHRYSLAKGRELLEKYAEDLDAAEALVAEIVAMPDLTPEQEEAQRQVNADARLVIQAFSLGYGDESGMRRVAELATNTGLAAERVELALQNLLTRGLVKISGEGFVRVKKEEAP